MRVLTLLSLVALVGCAGTVRTVEPSAELAVVERAVAGRTATLVLRDGSEHRARSVALAPDTISWVNADTGEALLAPTAALAEVRLRNRGRATARTAGAGALVGAGLGMLFGAALCSGDCLGLDLVVSTFYTGLGAVSGAFYGALGGAGSNRPDRYLLLPRDTPYQGDLVVPDRRTNAPTATRPPAPPAGQWRQRRDVVQMD